MSDFPGLVKALADVGGWAAFAALAAVVIGLLATGKVVPGSVVDAQRAELKELREMVKDDVLPPVKEIVKGVASVAERLKLLTDFFVKGVGGARERRDD